MNKLRLFRLNAIRQSVQSPATQPKSKQVPTRHISTTSTSEPAHFAFPYLYTRIHQTPFVQQSKLRTCIRYRPKTASKIPRMTIDTHSAVIDSVYEPKTGTWQYIVADPETLDAVIIDSVLDFDGATQSVSTTTADDLIRLIMAKGYKVQRILETHVHADHLTAASYLRTTLEQMQGSWPLVCIGKRIRGVQQMFAERYGVPEDELSSAFDCLLEDDETFQVGKLQVEVTHLPGHTPDHVGYMIAGQ